MSPASTPRVPFADRVRRFVGHGILRARDQARTVLRHHVVGEPELFDPPVEGLPHYPVLAHFAEAPDLIYQIRQWLPMLERLAEHQPVAVVTRTWATTVALRGMTTLPVLYTRKLDGLRTLYEQVDAKTIVYVNNGMRNFQSLIYQRALHVHVNHGESDKISMVSNQAKAYDHVVVAGQAAVDRHRRALINFGTDRLVVCGRPQLDLDIEPSLPPSDRRTVMYAPTWSGEDDANNYTSLDRYGVTIVQALVARGDVRVVYKPHPRVLTTGDRAVARAHQEIRRLLQTDTTAGHLLPFDADILSLFDGVDLLVTDISSVGLDFLYLRPEAPILLTDRRTDADRLRTDAPVSAATEVVDADTIDQVPAILDASLTDDPHHDARIAMRDYYFGFTRGESSRRFLNLVEECIERRDALLVSD